MTSPVPDAPLLVLRFDGWAQIRQPTDPDPSDEPRGASGYTFAFGDEPDLDGIVRFQPSADVPVRSYGWDIGVSVTQATHVVGTAQTDLPALSGAAVDLLGKPRLENRNWTLTPAGYEPIVPFDLQIDQPSVLTIRRTAPFTDDAGKPITDPIWKIPVSTLETQGANGFELEPATVGQATGLWDSLAVAVQRRASLQAELDRIRPTAPPNSPAVAILEGRIAELDIGITNPQDRRVAFRAMIERFGFDMNGPVTITGDEAAVLGGTLDRSSGWGIRFWIGAWDPDVLSAYVSGALIAPYTTD